ncbi:hypothetical protein Tco_0054244 [Tanacetum coccineum]
MVNIIPPDHVDDVPVVELNQHDDVPVVLEPVLVDEDEDPKEEEFEEEEPQEEENDIEVDIEEDENELELTYPYEEVDHLNPPPPASESEPEDVIEVENTIESEDKTAPASVHEERIFKKRTKNEAKTTKPNSEWKSRKKTKSKSKPKPEKVNRKSTQVNPEAKSQEK